SPTLLALTTEPLGLLGGAPAALDAARARAQAIELEAVTHQVEPEAARDPLLLLLDVGVLELEHVLALDADQVIMVLCVTRRLVHRLALAEAAQRGEPAFGQQLERAIHGRV